MGICRDSYWAYSDYGVKERTEKRGIPIKILVMDSTDDKSQEKAMAENKNKSKNKSGTDSTETEKPEKKR